MANILQEQVSSINILPYTVALADQAITNARDTLYRLKHVKKLLPKASVESFNNFANIEQPSSGMPPLLSPESTGNFILSERTNADANTYIQPFNSSIGIMDEPLNMQKYAFDMYLKLQTDKLNNLNKELTTLESKKKLLTSSNSSYPIKSIKNTATAVAINVDEYTSRGKSTSNYGVPYKKASQSGSSASKCTSVNNLASNYYLLYGNRGCLSYDDPNHKYSFQPCNANDSMQQFYINPVNNICDYNNFASDKIKSNSTIKMGFNVITPRTNVNKCLTTYPDNSVTVEPCTLNITNNQKFNTYYKNIL